MAVVLLVGMIEVGLHLTSSSPAPERERIPALAADVPPATRASWRSDLRPRAGPAGGDAELLHRADRQSGDAVAVGRRAAHAGAVGPLPPFSAVQGLRLLKSNGMVEVKVTDTTTGFVEAGRLTPGDPVAAQRAGCTYHAGPTPANGEVMRAAPPATRGWNIENLSGQPAVIKLRSPDGALLTSIFLGPGGEAVVEGLPGRTGAAGPRDGEVWSRACHGFEAGCARVRCRTWSGSGLCRVWRSAGAGVATVDLTDQAFEQE